MYNLWTTIINLIINITKVYERDNNTQAVFKSSLVKQIFFNLIIYLIIFNCILY